MKIGSVCSGYEGLGLAVQEVMGGELAWVADNDPGASAILAHHFPLVPNHGDITKANWSAVEPVDLFTAGFPCTDVSLSGAQAGLRADTRSGVWNHCARAIDVLRPSLVLIENVRGLLSVGADSPVEPCPWCVGDQQEQPALRALGAVLGDLADLGFDAEWVGLPASDDRIGAPHERWREFILAWPAAEDSHRAAWRQWRAAAPGQAEGGRARADARGRGGVPAAPASAGRLNLLPTPKASDGSHGGPNQRDSAGNYYLCGLVGRLDAQWIATDGTDYGPAIRRWEQVLGRPAPCPTEPGSRGNRRLSARFAEWMMGLDEGHVTAVPGLDRNAQLHAIGNGVVPQQGAVAVRLLLERAGFPLEHLASEAAA